MYLVLHNISASARLFITIICRYYYSVGINFTVKNRLYKSVCKKYSVVNHKTYRIPGNRDLGWTVLIHTTSLTIPKGINEGLLVYEGMYVYNITVARFEDVMKLMIDMTSGDNMVLVFRLDT